MKDCNNCKHKLCWEYAEPCSSCTNMTGAPTNWEPQTNADRIRAMSDEELAEWLCDIAGWLPMYEGKMHPIMDWLRQEAEEGAGTT